MELQLKKHHFIELDEITDEEKSAVDLGLAVQQTGTLGCNWAIVCMSDINTFSLACEMLRNWQFSWR